MSGQGQTGQAAEPRTVEVLEGGRRHIARLKVAAGQDKAHGGGGHSPGDHAGMNCLKIGLPGKLILSK